MPVSEKSGSVRRAEPLTRGLGRFLLTDRPCEAGPRGARNISFQGAMGIGRFYEHVRLGGDETSRQGEYQSYWQF